METRKFLRSLLVTSALLLIITNAKFQWGICPTTPTSHPNGSLNVTKLMGIWYEYLATPGAKDGDTYDCASWLMMQEKVGDAEFGVIFSNQDLSTNSTDMKIFNMDCTPTQYKTNTAVCYFNKN